MYQGDKKCQLKRGEKETEEEKSNMAI